MEDRFSGNDQQLTAILATSIKNNSLFNEKTDTYSSNSQSFFRTPHSLLISSAIVFFLSMLLGNGRQAHILKDVVQDPCPSGGQSKKMKGIIPHHRDTGAELQNIKLPILVKEKEQIKDLLTSLRVHFNTKEQYILDLFIKIFELDENLKTINDYRRRESTEALSGLTFTREQSTGILRTLQPYLPPGSKIMVEEILKLIEVIDNFNNYTKTINSMGDQDISFAEKGRELIKVFKPILSEKLKKSMDKMVKMAALIEMMNQQGLDSNANSRDDGTAQGQPCQTTVGMKGAPSKGGEKDQGKSHGAIGGIPAQGTGDDATDASLSQTDNDNDTHCAIDDKIQGGDANVKKDGINDKNGGDQHADDNISKGADNNNMLDDVKSLLNDESQREKLSKLMELAKYMAQRDE